MGDVLRLEPGHVDLTTLERLYRGADSVEIDPACRAPVEVAAALVGAAAAGDAAVYGINTGFGKLGNTRVAPGDTIRLQKNLVRSHCSGIGDPLPGPVVRLMMILKLVSLGRAASGVRWAVIELLQDMIARDVIPVVPSKGSVGASGDLAPLAHLTAVLIGEGEAVTAGERLAGGEALARVGLKPLELGPKEGLAMLNGTQCSTALALAALFDAHRLACTALATGALSTDAAMGSPAPFLPIIHELRGHPGQIDAAHSLRRLMAGSAISASHRFGDERVQDPYCLRCQPQVMGAALDLLRTVARTLCIEANAVTDNPLVISEDGAIVSGGNFHAEPVAFAADQIALALAEIGSIAQRRIALLMDPALSFGLPAFLAADAGLNSGFMIAEVTSAALMAENRHLANPCSVDSTPTSANQEDHVSMAAHAALRLTTMNRNLAGILGVELLAAAQGVEFRAPLPTSMPLAGVVDAVRELVPTLAEDRVLSGDIETATNYLFAAGVIDAAGQALFPALESHL